MRLSLIKEPAKSGRKPSRDMTQTSYPSTFVYAILFIQIFSSVQAWPLAPEPSRTANFTQCRADILNPTLAYEPYWVDIYGQRTFNQLEAVGADMGTCVAYCGSSPSAFEWSNFSPQFTGWLLPSLALLAQLPYEANGLWHNLMCLFLTVGSPPLAMYSLALTLLNSRYAKQLLDSLPIPKNIDEQLQFDELKTAVFQALRISQQEPFAVAIRSAGSPGGLDLAIVRAWWRSVRESLVKSARWFTASLATQAAWAIIAFAFTWVDAFGPSKVGTNITAFGLTISLCWSWVTLIVLGWYFAGVSFSKASITDAVEQADKMHPDAFPRLVTYKRSLHDQDRSHFALTRRIAGDVEHPGPIYNYARVLVWSHMVYYLVETIRQDTSLFRTVRDQDEEQQQGQQQQEHRHQEQQQQQEQQRRQEEEEEQQQEQRQQEQPGIQQMRWQHEQQGAHELQFLRPPATPERFHSVTSSASYSTQPLTRSQNADVERGKDTPIVARYLWEDKGVVVQWKRDAHGRMTWAIVCATLLSLMTVGSAFGLDFVTPSIGLGCWTGGMLIYWMVSYIILVVLILAALISDLWSVRETRMLHYKMQESTVRGMSYRLMGTIAVALRLLGKLLAFLNSAWIVIHCFFGFTPFYDTCYCLTNRGTTFWLWLDGAQLRDLGNTERFWGGFASATGVTCLFFIIFMRGWTAKRL